jgi:hypothetical protein
MMEQTADISNKFEIFQIEQPSFSFKLARETSSSYEVFSQSKFSWQIPAGNGRINW